MGLGESSRVVFLMFFRSLRPAPRSIRAVYFFCVVLEQAPRSEYVIKAGEVSFQNIVRLSQSNRVRT